MSRSTMRALLTMPVALSAFSEACAPGAPSTAPIEQVLRAAVERGDVPGVVALLTDRKGVIYQGAFGVADVATGRPLTADALFRIASMTKAITSVAAMQLIEQGKLALEDPVERHLPEIAKVPVVAAFDPKTGEYRMRRAARPMTIRHILTHTAGLGYGFTSATLRDLKLGEGQSYPEGPLLFDPGERWLYSTATDTVGRVVERISGQKLEDYFQEHILAPLRMTDTSYNVPEAKGARVAAAQQRAGERMDGPIVRQPVQPALTIPAPGGGSGLASTASDYGRFVRMLLNGGELDGVRVLKAETVAAMGRNHIGETSVPALKTTLPRSADFSFIADGRDKWGLGFLITVDQVPGKRSPGSLSWGGINNTYFWVDPSRGIAGVILMQYLPFADAKALAVYDAFERAAYRVAGAG